MNNEIIKFVNGDLQLDVTVSPNEETVWCASSVQLIQLGETPNLVTLGAKRPVSSPWALYREVQC